LLYYIAGYDPNAAQSAKSIHRDSIISPEKSIEPVVIENLIRFASLELHYIVYKDAPKEKVEGIKNYRDLKHVTREAMLWELNECLVLFKKELTLVHNEWDIDIEKRLLRLHRISTNCGESTILLLALILLLVNRTFPSRANSILQSPGDCPLNIWNEHMQRYLDERVFIIWPPHKEAIEKGLLNHQNNIIAIPTGTGKSLIAEHKVISSLQRGPIIIYLAPTHALCRQISERMKKIIDVQNLFSDQILLIDDLDNLNRFEQFDSSKLILVMTPEKCTSLYAKRSELFIHVSLYVVDEFHNIKEGNRGALLDSLLARVSENSENAVYLLMSALLDKSTILPKWLEALNNKPSDAVYTRWRPARTLRGFISHPSKEYNNALEEARKSGKKSYSKELSTDLFFCVQDVWNDETQKSAYPIRLPDKLKIRFKLSKFGNWTTEGYGNDMARQLGNWLATCNLPVLIFSQTTRHLIGEIAAHKKINKFEYIMNRRVDAYLTFAEIELGEVSDLEEGLINGIGIHSQALIDEEQEAVEAFFKSCNRGVVCATGTLAQGLNLPASAVVVNTTKQYNADDIPKPMSKEEVINMLGRAGRPGLAFQSIGVIVPQYPSSHNKNGFTLAPEYNEYLERIDAVVPVGSGLTQILNSVASSPFENALDNYTFLLNTTTKEDQINKKIISKTLASYLLDSEVIDNATDNCDKWLSIVQEDPLMKQYVDIAKKSAVSIKVAKTLWESIDEEGTLFLVGYLDATIGDWLNWYMSNIRKLTGEFLIENVHNSFKHPEILCEFLIAWTSGKTIKEIGDIMVKHGVGVEGRNHNRNNQGPIAKVVHILQDGIRNISHLANCYITIIESMIEKTGYDYLVPEGLQMLPSFISWGVKSNEALKFRKRGLPRLLSIQLGKEFGDVNYLGTLINEWKETGDIPGMDYSEKVKNAIFQII
ncbi:DEAD/DEAH box helicase, partial [Paenibacillus sp. P3E]|uniref:DEAD/DEAH box helicase n=1 Tax=Paenibacillus sp. P3E TaxID=1349435 RepID=UPI0009F9AA71